MYIYLLEWALASFWVSDPLFWVPLNERFSPLWVSAPLGSSFWKKYLQNIGICCAAVYTHLTSKLEIGPLERGVIFGLNLHFGCLCCVFCGCLLDTRPAHPWGCMLPAVPVQLLCPQFMGCCWSAGSVGTRLIFLSDYNSRCHWYSCPHSLFTLTPLLFYSAPIFLPVFRNSIKSLRLYVWRNKPRCVASPLCYVMYSKPVLSGCFFLSKVIYSFMLLVNNRNGCLCPLVTSFIIRTCYASAK